MAINFDADTDIKWYRLMTAWKEHDKIDFNFHDAHDLNNLMKTASEEQIKRKLRERMSNTKQAIVLVGDNTKNLFKFVRWEIEVAIKLDIPIIAVNLDKNKKHTSKTPTILINNAYFVSVPFEQKMIKHTLDLFPSKYHREKNNAPSARYYE